MSVFGSFRSNLTLKAINLRGNLISNNFPVDVFAPEYGVTFYLFKTDHSGQQIEGVWPSRRTSRSMRRMAVRARRGLRASFSLTVMYCLRYCV